MHEQSGDEGLGEVKTGGRKVSHGLARCCALEGRRGGSGRARIPGTRRRWTSPSIPGIVQSCHADTTWDPPRGGRESRRDSRPSNSRGNASDGGRTQDMIGRRIASRPLHCLYI